MSLYLSSGLDLTRDITGVPAPPPTDEGSVRHYHPTRAIAASFQTRVVVSNYRPTRVIDPAAVLAA